MSPLTFAQALERAELLARQSFDAALHERLSCAVNLVRSGSVFQDDTGHWTVASTTTPDKRYSVNGACACEDAFYRAPQGRCKHKLAQLLARKVAHLMQQPAEPAEPVSLPEEMEVFPDNDPGELPMEPPAPPPAPLPEAPASVNVRVTIAGREVQWTLRDTDEARLAIRLAALLARYPVPQSTPQASSQGKDFCHVHQVPMKQTTKDGKSWLSHYDQAAGKWCKGRG
jgi:hypothetical protein